MTPAALVVIMLSFLAVALILLVIVLWRNKDWYG